MIKKVLLFGIAVLFAGFLSLGIADAHSGRTNSSGCHNDYVHGGYHCHNGGYSVPVAPAIKTYSWHLQTYYSYSSYYQARWDDIQAMYRELLGRPFNSQEEGKIYTDQTNMDYYTIRLEIMGSDEYQQKHPPKPAQIIPISQPITNQEKPNYSWIWWTLGIGTLVYVIWIANKKD